MTYEEARAFIEGTKKYGSILGLESIRALMEELEDVQEKLSIIHVAGTNGKGSVCACLVSVLTEMGYVVGRYSSPAVFTYEEMIQVNGRNMDRDRFASVVERVQQACVRMVGRGMAHPTSFEVETAAAFCCFEETECQYVVLETGMGGATDATNLITHPLCSVLTSISMDHMAFLGDTIAKITEVKAGIIKEGCPVVTALQSEEARNVIRQVSERKHSKLYIAEEERIENLVMNADNISFEYPLEGKMEKITSGITGSCQVHNIACALRVLEVLNLCGVAVSRKAVLRGIHGVNHPGRFYKIESHPDVILDGAHNEAAAVELRRTLECCYPGKKIVFIMGVLADKEYEKILSIMMPLAECVYTVTPPNPRALAGEQLAERIRVHSVKAVSCIDMTDVLNQAKREHTEEDVIVAFGSLYYLHEIL